MCPYLGISLGVPNHRHLDDDGCALPDVGEPRVVTSKGVRKKVEDGWFAVKWLSFKKRSVSVERKHLTFRIEMGTYKFDPPNQISIPNG